MWIINKGIVSHIRSPGTFRQYKTGVSVLYIFHACQEFLRKQKMYVQYAAKFEEEHYVWRERKSFASFQPSDEKELEKILSYIPKYQQKISDAVEKEIGISLNLQDCESLSLKEDEILGMISVLKDDETFSYFQAMWDEDDDETSLLWLSNIERVAMSCFEGENPEVTIPEQSIGCFSGSIAASDGCQDKSVSVDHVGNFLQRKRIGKTRADREWAGV